MVYVKGYYQWLVIFLSTTILDVVQHAILAFLEYKNCLFGKTLLPNEWKLKLPKKMLLVLGFMVV